MHTMPAYTPIVPATAPAGNCWVGARERSFVLGATAPVWRYFR